MGADFYCNFSNDIRKVTFIRKVNLCRINIIEVLGFNLILCLTEFLAAADFPQVLQVVVRFII